MKYAAFGEIMMRIAPEGNLRLRQAMPGKVDVTFAGGEANTCASIALLGGDAGFITALPDNMLSQCVLANLRAVGVDTGGIMLTKKGRLGIFLLETGANQRSSVVVYDREGSSIALASPDDYDFPAVLADRQWLHITGITPALSENAYLSSLAAVRAAKELGLTVSCDLNFRGKLWRWKAGYSARQLARECMTEILKFVDLVIANEEDAKDVLGIEASGTSVEAGVINAAAYREVAERIVDMFGNVSKVAITLRQSISASHNNWGGMLYDAQSRTAHFAPTDADGAYKPYEIKDIVDRVGGGDSFAGGLIYALNSDEFAEPAKAVAFAAAASCLKHSIKGDFNYVTRDEVAALMKGSGSGRVRR